MNDKEKEETKVSITVSLGLIVLIILCVGTPDLIDAAISRLMVNNCVQVQK